MRTFVIGDIHGAYRALVQVLERCEFDKEKDLLITLGDICDGWPEVYECVEELLTCQNRIDIVGNHDEWFVRFLETVSHPDLWSQGGLGTAFSYAKRVGKHDSIERKQVRTADSKLVTIYYTSLLPEDIPDAHRHFFKCQQLYYKDDGRNMLFVHAGFDRWKSISENRRDHAYLFYWDRDLWANAKSCIGKKLATVDNFDTIYIGHTAVGAFSNGHPVEAGGVWNLDTGAGWYGKLTIMDVDTREYWQSDLVGSLYPGGRSR